MTELIQLPLAPDSVQYALRWTAEAGPQRGRTRQKTQGYKDNICMYPSDKGLGLPIQGATWSS